MRLSRIVYRDQGGNLMPLPAWLRVRRGGVEARCPRCRGRMFRELDDRGEPELVCINCGERDPDALRT